MKTFRTTIETFFTLASKSTSPFPSTIFSDTPSLISFISQEAEPRLGRGAPLPRIAQYREGDGVCGHLGGVWFVLHHVLQPEVAVVEAEAPLGMVQRRQHLEQAQGQILGYSGRG